MAEELEKVEQSQEPEKPEETPTREAPPAEDDTIWKAREYDRILYQLSVDPYGTLKRVADDQGLVLIDPRKEPEALAKRNGQAMESEDDELDSILSPKIDPMQVKEIAKQAVEELERERALTLQKAKRLAKEAKAYIKQQQPNFSAFERVYDKIVESLDPETAKEVTATGGITALAKEAELQAYREGVIGRGGVPLSPVSGSPEGAEADEDEQMRIALGWSREKWREIKKREKELFTL